MSSSRKPRSSDRIAIFPAQAGIQAFHLGRLRKNRAAPMLLGSALGAGALGPDRPRPGNVLDLTEPPHFRLGPLLRLRRFLRHAPLRRQSTLPWSSIR